MNDGDLLLRGDNGSLGSGGASLTTTSTPFANYGDLYVDSYGYGDGGSTATFGGILTNDGTFNIGNSGLSAATKVTATGLDNTGALNLAGSSSLADLVVSRRDDDGQYRHRDGVRARRDRLEQLHTRRRRDHSHRIAGCEHDRRR